MFGFLAVLLGLYAYHSAALVPGETDGIGYMLRATGPVFVVHTFHGPGYSLAIRLGHSLGLDLFAAGKAVSLVAGLLFVGASWAIFSAWATRREATLAAGLLAFSPLILERSVTVLSDMLAAALAMAALACLLAPRRVTGWHFLAAGLCAGLAYLTRYVYLVLAVAPLTLLLLESASGWPARLKRAALGLGSYGAGFLLVSLPWLHFLYRETGSPFFNQNYRNVAFKMHFRDSEGFHAFPAPGDYSGWGDVFASDPGLFLSTWATTLLDLPGAILGLFPYIGLLGGLGLFFWLARPKRSKLVYLSVAGVYGLAVSLVWLVDRFLLIYAPLLAVAIVQGVMALPRGDKLPVRQLAWVVVAAGLVLSLSWRLPAYFADQAFEYHTAATWLAAQTDSATLLSSKEHIPFFSDHAWQNFRAYNLQYRPVSELPDILAEAQPTYFIYDERFGLPNFPHYKAFLDPQTNPYPALLTPVYVVNSPMRLVIYRYEG